MLVPRGIPEGGQAALRHGNQAIVMRIFSRSHPRFVRVNNTELVHTGACR